MAEVPIIVLIGLVGVGVGVGVGVIQSSPREIPAMYDKSAQRLSLAGGGGRGWRRGKGAGDAKLKSQRIVSTSNAV